MGLMAVLGLVAQIQAAQAQAVEPQWDPRYYNPKPADGDVILPMPCGGAMAFRKVTVPAADVMDDHIVKFGSLDERYGYAEYFHTGYISGTFPGGANERYFLIGKYEVNALQYAAFHEVCPAPKTKMRLPATQVSWIDAVVFADRYSRWLLKEAVSELPVDQDEPGYVRLPTDEEWEFAARGGLAVPQSQFVEPVFPMPDGMAEYVWFAGSQSANGRVRFIGLLKPSPLGLHDILGNVDEIVFDPFRLRKGARSHGQAGGVIVRGGNVFTGRQDVRAAHRTETPLYQGNQPRRSKTTGFRLVVTAPVIASRGKLKEIEKAWADVGTVGDDADDRPRLEGKPLEDPLEEITAIAEAADDDNMVDRLKRLGGIFRAERQARDEHRDLAAQVSIRLGGYLCSKIGSDGLTIDLFRKSLGECANQDDETFRARCEKRYKGPLARSEKALLPTTFYYSDTVDHTSTLYSDTVLMEQFGKLRPILEQQGLGELVAFSNAFKDQVVAYGDDGRIQRQAWLDACKKLRSDLTDSGG